MERKCTESSLERATNVPLTVHAGDGACISAGGSSKDCHTNYAYYIPHDAGAFQDGVAQYTFERSANACQARCAAAPECAFFTFYAASGGACALSSSKAVQYSSTVGITDVKDYPTMPFDFFQIQPPMMLSNMIPDPTSMMLSNMIPDPTSMMLPYKIPDPTPNDAVK
eukprot:gene2691-3465_t